MPAKSENFKKFVNFASDIDNRKETVMKKRHPRNISIAGYLVFGPIGEPCGNTCDNNETK